MIITAMMMMNVSNLNQNLLLFQQPQSQQPQQSAENKPDTMIRFDNANNNHVTMINYNDHHNHHYHNYPHPHALQSMSPSTFMSSTIILTIVTILATPSNILVIWVVLKTPTLRMKAVNMLIVNLCLLDLIASLLDLPLIWVILQFNYNHVRFDRIICNFQLFIHHLTISGQLLSFASVGYERYHTVSNPFDKEKVRKITHFLVINIWLSAILIPALELQFTLDTIDYAFCTQSIRGTGHLGILFIMLPFGFVCFLFVAYFYARIVWLVRKHCKNVNTTCRKYVGVTTFGNGTDISNVSELPSIYGEVCVLDSRNRSLGRRKIEAETAKRSFFVIVSFVAFTLPYPLMIIIERILNHTNHQPQPDQKSFWFEWEYCLNLMSLLSSAFNPIIYGLANRQFRSAFNKICHRYYRRYKSRDYI